MNVAASKTGLQRPPIGRVLVAEGVLLLLAVSVVWWCDTIAGRSVLLGGLIVLRPQAWFSWRVFRVRGAGAMREVAQGFYRAEAGKFLLVTVGFALAFAAAPPVAALWLFGAYMVLLFVNSVLLGLSGAI